MSWTNLFGALYDVWGFDFKPDKSPPHQQVTQFHFHPFLICELKTYNKIFSWCTEKVHYDDTVSMQDLKRWEHVLEKLRAEGILSNSIFESLRT